MTAFFFGFLGGVLAELVKHYRLVQQTSGPMPDAYKGWYYWSVTVGMMFAGGILAVAYKTSGQNLSAIIELNIGASAPLIIGAFASAKAPKID